MDATQEYEQIKQEITNRLIALSEMIENHDMQSGHFKHWGHVGDLNHVGASLTDIEEFISR